MALHEMPYNANQLAEHLGLDYKTIRHHLDVLVEHRILIPQGEGYGMVYFVSDDIENNFEDFEEIWVRIRGKLGKHALKESEK